MIVPTYFKDFLKDIRLTENQVNDLKTGHTTLRDRLNADEELSPIIVNTFLQGSYKRSTAVRPKGGSRSDVDIIVVTNINSEECTPQEALDKFKPFLDKHYEGKYRIQGRSIGIELSYVDLDIVPTSAPSEAQEDALERSFLASEIILENYTGDSIFLSAKADAKWKDEPLLIPDREAKVWDETHPLEQIDWTLEKNKNTNGHYINVVKCLKWWRKGKYPDAKHPKSYPLEHFIGDCCPDGIESVAEGIFLTLEKIVDFHPSKPFLADRGVPSHNVFGRLTDEEYIDFYDTVCDAAKIAREAYNAESIKESVEKWRELFGNKFPPYTDNSTGGFTQRVEKSEDIPEGRFA